MPVINCLDLTKAAFESIHADFEIDFILIDQASDDGTEDWGLSMEGQSNFGREHPVNFTYIRNNPRIPLAAAWNQGIDLALEDPECEHIAILNNDIVLHPKTLTNLMQFQDRTGYLLVTADNIKDRMSIDTLLRMELPLPYIDYDCQPINDWRAEGPDFSCFMISPDFVRVIGRIDENYLGAYCEDWDTHRRIRAAYMHAKEHNDQGIDPERIHAKRLSTAPYYHYASQTISRNLDLKGIVSAQHARNIAYYESKWGTTHNDAMDGLGNKQPFGDATKNWRDW